MPRLWQRFREWWFSQRYICRECSRTWDRWRCSVDPPGVWLMSHIPPPDGFPSGHYHFRAESVPASDGVRRVEVRCGPIQYEGQRI